MKKAFALIYGSMMFFIQGHSDELFSSAENKFYLAPESVAIT